MKLKLLHILLITLLLAFGSGMALADVKFDSFTSRPPAKVQSSGSKSPGKAHKPKRIQPARKKPQPRKMKTKPSKSVFSSETVKGGRQQVAVCKEKLQMHYKKGLQQAVSWSRKFATEQVGNAKLATMKVIKEGERWAGQCKGEF